MRVLLASNTSWIVFSQLPNLQMEIYVSTDVEADGPIPGPNSMLSFGSAAYTAEKELLGTFSANLETLPGAAADPKTAEWWTKHPEAWTVCRQNLECPEAAMRRYVAWVKALPDKPVFVGYPAGFDFLFVYWYPMRFAGESPFSFSALDIKTYAMALLKKDYRKSIKGGMPKHWFDPYPHTHIALDDAIEQGALFCNMLAENCASLEKAKLERVLADCHPDINRRGVYPRSPRRSHTRRSGGSRNYPRRRVVQLTSPSLCRSASAASGAIRPSRCVQGQPATDRCAQRCRRGELERGRA